MFLYSWYYHNYISYYYISSFIVYNIKVILYNNLSQFEVRKAVNDTRENIKDGILAVVTEQSINWKVNYLIKHLKNERDWYSKVRKEIKDE